MALASNWDTTWSFKVTEVPIKLTTSHNETAKKIVEEVASENMPLVGSLRRLYVLMYCALLPACKP